MVMIEMTYYNKKHEKSEILIHLFPYCQSSLDLESFPFSLVSLSAEGE